MLKNLKKIFDIHLGPISAYNNEYNDVGNAQGKLAVIIPLCQDNDNDSLKAYGR